MNTTFSKGEGQRLGTELPTEVKVFTPATVANVACGFDILGCALECPGD